MKTFKLKALPLATAAALAMIPYSLSAQPLVNLNVGVNASATSSINLSALGPLSGTNNASLGHNLGLTVLNPSGSGDPLKSVMSGLQGSDCNNTCTTSTLPGLSQDDSAEQEGSEDGAADPLAKLTDGLKGSDEGEDSSLNATANALVEATLDGSLGGGDLSSLTLPGLSEGESSENGTSEDGAADPLAKLTDGLKGSDEGEDSSLNATANALVEATLEANLNGGDSSINAVLQAAAEATASAKNLGQKEHATEPETSEAGSEAESSEAGAEPDSSEPEVASADEGTDESAGDSSTQPDAQVTS